MGENFEWGPKGATPPSGAPNWSMAPPPGGPMGPPADPGPPKPPLRGRTIRTAAIATVSAGVLAIVGVSVASAQSSGSTTTTPSTITPGSSTTAPGTAKPALRPRGGPGGGFFGGPGGPDGLGAGGSIHGNYVRPDGKGGYQTIDTQIGVVVGKPGASATTIEIKSVDGFDQTYSVTTNTVVNSGRDGIGSVNAGDTVQVEAVVSGTPPVAEAASIVDRTTLGSIQGHFRPQRPATTPSTTTG